MKFLVLGYGESAKAVIEFLNFYGQEVSVSVKKNEMKKVVHAKKVFLFDEEIIKYGPFDYVFRSPGIPMTNKVYRLIKENFTVISEADLFAIFDIHLNIIGITGSNGKTTTVDLISSIYKHAHILHKVAGNSHNPISKIALELGNSNNLILELSSFQLEDLNYFKPDIAAIVNMQPNHLDSVSSLENYYASKANITKNMDYTDHFILNYDDENIQKYLGDIHFNVITYSINHKSAAIYINDGNIYFHKKRIISLAEITEDLRTYLDQVMISLAVCILKNISLKHFLYAVKNFKKAAYREQKTIFNDMIFINDSKSTSPSCTLHALKNNNHDSRALIIGGYDKKLDFSIIDFDKLDFVCSIGAISENIAKLNSKIVKFNTLEEAFDYCVDKLNDKGMIIFSPGTSSFDAYKSYSERGKHFDQLIAKYKEGAIHG